MSTTLPAGFVQEFRTPGEFVFEPQFTRFERFLARNAEETFADYRARLVAAGLAVGLTTTEARDIPFYKQRIAEAEARGLPVAVLTDTVYDGDSDTRSDAEREATKADALKAARGQQ